MLSPLFILRPMEHDDLPAVDDLLDLAFGPGRHARTASRLREGVAPDFNLSLVALFGGRLGGTLTMTPMRIGNHPALLLGPLAVHPDFEGKGAGRALVRAALAAAAERGHEIVLLVGDEPYYGPLGFEHVSPQKIQLPGPVAPNRVLVAELKPGALAQVSGLCMRALKAS
ncbi:GNAT family N-acetyltransferase [Methyloraptor flagellatus]|uniref:N-acetyltransferase n=1 Tax=Methyloraptor flagellatus TaxID=3162530 RepID=A0AAU7XDL7_9HYPH